MKLDFARLDPEITPILGLLPPMLADINRDNVHEVRGAMKRPPLPVNVPVVTHQVTTPDGVVDVLLYNHDENRDKNHDKTTARPAVLWIHGGGYVMGTAQDNRAGIIAESLGVTVASVDYRLAPEHPFPAAMTDCHAALDWLMQSPDLNIDRTRVAIGGASAGGGLAAGLALKNRDNANYPLALQLLLYPMIDNLHDTPSGQYDNHPVWCRKTSFNAWEMYLGGVPGLGASPYSAATRASELAGLPPAYICVGSEDLFRDEDIQYAQRLSEAGVPTELGVFPGLYHGADGLVPQAAISRRLNRSFLAALGDALKVT